MAVPTAPFWMVPPPCSRPMASPLLKHCSWPSPQHSLISLLCSQCCLHGCGWIDELCPGCIALDWVLPCKLSTCSPDSAFHSCPAMSVLYKPWTSLRRKCQFHWNVPDGLLLLETHELNQVWTAVCFCLKKPAWVLASAHGVVPEHIRMSLIQRKRIWLEYGNPMVLWKRDFFIENVPWWCSSKQTSFTGELYASIEKLSPLGPVWEGLLPFPFRGDQAHLSSSYSSHTPKGEISSSCPEFERPLFRWSVQKGCCGMGGRPRTGNGGKSQHPSPGRALGAGCKAECLARTFAFLMHLSRGRTCLGALWKLLSLRPKPPWADYQWIWLPQVVCPAVCITLTQDFHCKTDTESDTDFPQHLGSSVLDILSFFSRSAWKNRTLETWYWLFQAINR